MIEQRFRDPTPIPEDLRPITWEIGNAELQKSVMAIETFEALRAGQNNVKRMRDEILHKRKLRLVLSPTGNWTETPSDRFVNEHAWVLAKMTLVGMIPEVNQRTKETSLLPGAERKLAEVVGFFQRNEPFEWKPGTYKKAPGW